VIDVRKLPERDQLQDDLDHYGHADLGILLSDEDARSLAALYASESPFRSHIVMRRHAFGEGDYKYFANPLPDRIASLRRVLYAHLAPIANRWQEQLGADRRFPSSLRKMLERCHADGQTRPTPLLLRYTEGGYNCLHQDLYGEHIFPLQVVVLLSDDEDFKGGQFVLTEQRPRMQSRVEVVNLTRGRGVVFAVNERPRKGKRGYYRVKSRHGVSRIHSGERVTLGIIFHDAA